jgi:hypothetical protein
VHGVVFEKNFILLPARAPKRLSGESAATRESAGSQLPEPQTAIIATIEAKERSLSNQKI